MGGIGQRRPGRLQDARLEPAELLHPCLERLLQIAGDGDVLKKIDLFAGKVVDGQVSQELESLSRIGHGFVVRVVQSEV